MDEWLRGARAEYGGLLIPGRPEGRAVDLLLAPGTAELRWRDQRVSLPWARCLAPTNGWKVADHRRAVRAGKPPVPVGEAVVVDGELRAACAGIARAAARARPLGAFIARLTLGRDEPHAVPLNIPRASTEEDGPARSTLVALVAVLAARPDARARLGDTARAARLAVYLAAGALGDVVLATPYGIRRETAEIGTAMRASGFVHPFGRPLPGDPLPSLDEAVARIVDYIAANPHAAGVTIDRQRVADLVRRRYLDVKPWPFDPVTG